MKCLECSMVKFMQKKDHLSKVTEAKNNPAPATAKRFPFPMKSPPTKIEMRAKMLMQRQMTIMATSRREK